jgi:hypothetical protein
MGTWFTAVPHFVTIHRRDGDHVRRYLGRDACEEVRRVEARNGVDVTIQTEADYRKAVAARRAARAAAREGAAA